MAVWRVWEQHWWASLEEHPTLGLVEASVRAALHNSEVPFIIWRFEQTELMTGFQASSWVYMILAALAMVSQVVLDATVTVLQVLVMQRLPDVGNSLQSAPR